MQTSNSLYGDDYSCFTYCYVKGAVLQGYCCIRSILCLSHCFKISNKFYRGGLNVECFGDLCRHNIKREKEAPFFTFQSMPILDIHSNRREETVSMPGYK